MTTTSQAHHAASVAEEWRRHWPLVLACVVGFALPTVAVNATGVFMDPLHRQFGWSRTQITAGLTVAGVLTIPLSPFVGSLIDRWGSRRIGLPGLALTALALSAIGLANGSFGQWMSLWTVYGLVALMAKSTVWTAAISKAFIAGRGTALAVALSGSTIAQIVTPPLANLLLNAYGVTKAYMLLGLIWGLPAVLLASVFLVEDGRGTARSGTGAAAAAPEFSGLTPREAMRCVPLLRIGLSTLIVLMLSAGILVHKVPLLIEQGVDRNTAAWLASLSGVAAIAGKFITGWLMDRFDAGLVGAGTLIIMALAFVPMLEPFRTPTMVVLSMMALGYSGGTKLQICVQLTGIYAGLRHFGAIFGVMASVIALAAGLGPMVTGFIYDLGDSYTPIIIGAIPACLVSALLLVRLGDYPAWHRPRAVAA
ncbi:MFS transporter [Novosphingobium bradum]|uniref:MFS transporter n=1 Tax=Novosphingobium bradum TaxID=1737444 RepID=A0ABV7IP02_9SPHN